MDSVFIDLLAFVDAKETDSVELGQFCNQDHQKGNDIDGKQGNIVMGVMSAQQEPKIQKLLSRRSFTG